MYAAIDFSGSPEAIKQDMKLFEIVNRIFDRDLHVNVSNQEWNNDESED